MSRPPWPPGPAAAPALATGEVCVWALDLARIGTRYDDALSADEQARADRFLRPEDRSRFRASHGGLRAILARHTGQPAAAIAFSEGPNGRPALDPPGPDFNLAHSGAYAVVAVANPGPVGIDIEVQREIERAGSLARHHFAPDEARAIEASRSQGETFLALWTLKEAVIKATGEGFGRSLASFTVRLHGESATLADLAGSNADGWVLHRLTPFRGTVAAIASPRGISGLHQWSLGLE